MSETSEDKLCTVPEHCNGTFIEDALGTVTYMAKYPMPPHLVGNVTLRTFTRGKRDRVKKEMPIRADKEYTILSVGDCSIQGNIMDWGHSMASKTTDCTVKVLNLIGQIITLTEKNLDYLSLIYNCIIIDKSPNFNIVIAANENPYTVFCALAKDKEFEVFHAQSIEQFTEFYTKGDIINKTPIPMATTLTNIEYVFKTEGCNGRLNSKTNILELETSTGIQSIVHFIPKKRGDITCTTDDNSLVFTTKNVLDPKIEDIITLAKSNNEYDLSRLSAIRIVLSQTPIVSLFDAPQPSLRGANGKGMRFNDYKSGFIDRQQSGWHHE